MADYESVAGRTGIIGTPESQSTLSDKNLQEALEALAEREDEVSKLHQQIKEVSSEEERENVCVCVCVWIMEGWMSPVYPLRT